MAYSKPMQALVEEHDVILSVLEAVEKVAAAIDRAGEFPQDFFEKAFDFFPTFADKCHHAKEETLLFPVLESRGIPRQGGPIGCMLTEHDEGRAHVAAVREALRRTATGNRDARQVVQREALAYAALLRAHIQKENEVLFVLGDHRLDRQDKEKLWEQFQHAEKCVIPAGTHDKYVALAAELRTAAGLGKQASGCSCAK